jgi:anaerobic selenocysteine-containing dehydrogenase
LSPVDEIFARLAALSDTELAVGVRLLPDNAPVEAFSAEYEVKASEPDRGQVELLLVDWIFGTDELAAYAASIQQVEEEPFLLLAAGLAAELGLAPGDRVAIQLPGGEVRVRLKTAPRMSPRVAVLPRHHGLSWQKLKEWPVWLTPDSISKI